MPKKAGRESDRYSDLSALPSQARSIDTENRAEYIEGEQVLILPRERAT
jgi:hypothetical protein